MRELPDDARAVLEAARSAHDPSRKEREQADGAVRATLASLGVHLPPLGPPQPARWEGQDTALQGAKLSGASAATAAKTGVGALVLFAGVWLGLSGYVREPAQPPLDDPPQAVALAAAVQTAPVGAPAAAPARPTAQIAPAAEPDAPATTAPAPSRSRVTAPRLREPGSDVDAELRMIAEADALLRAERFDAALRVLALHSRRFAHGALREERAALRVLALCGQGPSPLAERERVRFLRAAPQSVLTARVGAACGGLEARSP